MLKLDVHNLEGKKTGDVAVDEAVFGLKPKAELINEVYVAQRANKRKGLSHTKTISERRGSTKKPWRQKGTGRARTGSVRNPIWRKGGVTFGPTKEQNFSKKVNKKAVKTAVKMALSSKVAEKQLIVVENYDLKNAKTKAFAQALDALKIGKKVLVSHTREEKAVVQASRNIGIVSNKLAVNVNIGELLDNTFLLLSKKGLEELQGRFVGGKEKMEKKER